MNKSLTDCTTHQLDTIAVLDQFVAAYLTTAIAVVLAIVVLVVLVSLYRHLERHSCRSCRRARQRTHNHHATCHLHA